MRFAGLYLPFELKISCRGLRILVEMLDEDYSENKTLILSSLEGIRSVFDLQVGLHPQRHHCAKPSVPYTQK